MERYILSIDQGTSSTKALLFDASGRVIKKGTAPLQTRYLPNGFVEQDPQDIVESTQRAARECLEGIPPGTVQCAGISNQRETFVLWDKTGNPVYPAVVWSCKRSVAVCNELKPREGWLRARTGLLADPYFSGTKLLWLLRNEPGLAGRIAAGEIYFGTVDTWLLYNLTGGQAYLTDHSNASRTLLFNLRELEWDREILQAWGLEGLHLPEVRTSAGDFGQTDLYGLLPEPIPVLSMIGDSHASLFGEACFEPGDTKITMGTGCSLLCNTGTDTGTGANGMLSTVGWSTREGVVYAREGAIVSCGSMVEWLLSVGIAESAEATEIMSREAGAESGVLLVPAFSGLGAPFWDMERRASFHGIDFGTTRENLVRATLETICFQIRAVLDAMEADGGHPIRTVALHGGLSRNGFVREALAGLLKASIRIQDNPDISAQGAAFLAGLEAGIFQDLPEIKALLDPISLGTHGPDKGIENKYVQWVDLIESGHL